MPDAKMCIRDSIHALFDQNGDEKALVDFCKAVKIHLPKVILQIVIIHMLLIVEKQAPAHPLPCLLYTSFRTAASPGW